MSVRLYVCLSDLGGNVIFSAPNWDIAPIFFVQNPLINDHLFWKYFVRLSVGNATKVFATYGCCHPSFFFKHFTTYGCHHPYFFLIILNVTYHNHISRILFYNLFKIKNWKPFRLRFILPCIFPIQLDVHLLVSTISINEDIFQGQLANFKIFLPKIGIFPNFCKLDMSWESLDIQA